MQCANLSSCASCTAVVPPPGVDFGVRCVWCPTLAGCRPYFKHSFNFPCADATRSGGGFPGGTCSRPARVPAASGLAAAPPREPPFEHAPLTSEPVSVVIASFGRPSNLPHQLLWLLQLEPMFRAGSEVIVSHGSSASLASRDAVDEALATGCRAGAGCARAPIVHRNATRENAEVFSAQRFFAAAGASCRVLVHLDDDLVPGGPMLQALVDAVALEPGFPSYERSPPGLYGPSGLARSCGARGYTRGHEAPDAASPAVLTGVSATSAVANARYLDGFADFDATLRRTRGNGEDLTFSDFVRRAGGERRSLGACGGRYRDGCATAAGELGWVRGGAAEPGSAASFHARPGHYESRGQLCRCLAAGLSREPLAECAEPRERTGERVEL